MHCPDKILNSIKFIEIFLDKTINDRSILCNLINECDWMDLSRHLSWPVVKLTAIDSAESRYRAVAGSGATGQQCCTVRPRQLMLNGIWVGKRRLWRQSQRRSSQHRSKGYANSGSLRKMDAEITYAVHEYFNAQYVYAFIVMCLNVYYVLYGVNLRWHIYDSNTTLRTDKFDSFVLCQV